MTYRAARRDRTNPSQGSWVLYEYQVNLGYSQFWARRLAQRRAQGSGIAVKDGMWPVGEGNGLVRVDRDVARVPDHYSAVLNFYGDPDLFGTAVCIDEFHVVATRGKRDTVRALCPDDVLLDGHALKVPLRIEERPSHEAIVHVHGDREAAHRGVRERYWRRALELLRARRL